MAPSKVPKFGDWDAEDAGYTVRFDTVRKGKPGGPIINPNDPQATVADIPPPATPDHHQAKPKAKQPEFGDWDEEEDVAYTQNFESKGKVITGPSEPQITYNVPLKTTPVAKPDAGRRTSPADPRAKPQGVQFAEYEPNKSPLHPAVAGRGRGNAPPVGPPKRAPATAGPSPGRGASVPVFGGWNDNPGQADGYTIAFKRVQEERDGVAPKDMDPKHPRYGHPTNQQQKQGGCFSCLFG